MHSYVLDMDIQPNYQPLARHNSFLHGVSKWAHPRNASTIPMPSSDSNILGASSSRPIPQTAAPRVSPLIRPNHGGGSHNRGNRSAVYEVHE